MAKKEDKVNSKENSKNKKSFWKSFKAELKKVTWPTPKQLANNTLAVIVMVLITAIIVLGLNLAFEAMNEHGVDKLKEIISTNETTDNEAEAGGEEEGTETNNESEENSEETSNNTENEDLTNQVVIDNNTSENAETSQNATTENNEEEQTTNEATSEQ